MKTNEIIYLMLMTITMQIIFALNYKNMTEQKIKIEIRYFLIILFTSIVLFLNNYYNIEFFKIFVGIIINIITILLIYKNKLADIIFYSIIHSIICILLELLLSPILLFKFENIEVFNNEVYFKIFFSLIIGSISILIFKNKKLKTFIEKIKYLLYKKSTISLLSLIILIPLNILLLIRGLDLSNKYIIIVTVEFVILLFITLRIIINDRYNIKVVEDKNKNLRDSYKAYSKTIEECKEFKHNIKNEIYSIKTTLPIKYQESLNKILKKYNNNYIWIDKIGEIPEGIQGLIFLKKKEAEQKKINIIINVKEDFNADDTDYLDLCLTIGILIDNAIEASEKAKSKIIELSIDNRKNELNITIINKFINSIDLVKIGKKNYSTKEYKSGLGLDYIKNMKNHRIKTNYKIINNLFITTLKYKR